MRRVGIVALARRLTIALWRYLEHDEIPAGAKRLDKRVLIEALALLWKKQGKSKEASRLLGEIYGWFTGASIPPT